MTGRKQENFIFGQALPSYAEMPYGRSTIGKAGCEAIACYNVMVLLGRPMPFSEVKAYFEGLFKHGLGWMAGGMLGATPIEIRMFLRKQGIRFTRIRSVRAFNRKKAAGELPPGVLIVSYWNKPMLKYGFHTVAVDCRSLSENKSADSAPPALYVYNRYGSSLAPSPITDLSQLMEGNGRFISGSYIPY